MRFHPPQEQSGFTLLEILITVAIATLSIVAGLQTFATADRLATDSRQHLRASAAYREAHQALRSKLRNAGIDTMLGFDSTGLTSEPRFREVLGLIDGAPELGPEQWLAYRGSAGVAHDIPGVGITEVGDIVLRTVGEPEEVVVRNAVRGSFRVRQEGRALVIRLTTLHGSDPRRMKRVSGETVLALRN